MHSGKSKFLFEESNIAFVSDKWKTVVLKDLGFESALCYFSCLNGSLDYCVEQLRVGYNWQTGK